jgi:hypothetical protein
MHGDVHGNVNIRSCAAASLHFLRENDYAESKFEEYEAEDFVCNDALHSSAEKNFTNFIEPWCPIKEIE